MKLANATRFVTITILVLRIAVITFRWIALKLCVAKIVDITKPKCGIKHLCADVRIIRGFKMSSPMGIVVTENERRQRMNHDATHCSDFKKGKCPKSCYRAELTNELRYIYYPLPTSWASFDGTKECPKTEGGQGNRMPKDERLRKTIGENIKQLMQENGYTQKQLAMRSGCTETAISRYFNGNRNPSLKALKNLAIALGVTVDELINEGGD